MSEVLELVRRAFAAADADDIDGFLACLAPDGDWLTPDGPLHGREEMRGFVTPFHVGFPGGRHAFDRVHEPSADTVIVEGRWYGTHTGPLPTPGGDVPPTGRSVVMSFALVVQSDDGRRAQRVALYMDRLGMMAQLGLMPEPASA